MDDPLVLSGLALEIGGIALLAGGVFTGPAGPRRLRRLRELVLADFIVVFGVAMIAAAVAGVAFVFLGTAVVIAALTATFLGGDLPAGSAHRARASRALPGGLPGPEAGRVRTWVPHRSHATGVIWAASVLALTGVGLQGVALS